MGSDSRLKRLALGTASIFLLIVGVLLNVPQMYLMAVIISLIPIVYWSIGHLLQQGLICERSLPDSCARNEQIPVRLTLRNTGILPKFYLRVSDRLPRWVLFDGNESDDHTVILRLRGGEEKRVSYYLRALHRGHHVIGPTKLTSSDLIGLSNYVRVLEGTDSIIVFPQVHRLSAQFISEGLSAGWHDQENAEARGTGSDFQGVREYRVGDDLRRLNWKTVARTGQLAVTEYSLGYARGMTIVLDTDRAVYDGSTAGRDVAFETAVEICASLAFYGLARGSSVTMITGRVDGLDVVEYAKFEEQSILLRTLAVIAPSSGSTLETSLGGAITAKNSDSMLLVISGRDPANTAVQTLLTEVARRRGSGRPVGFWIDIPEFSAAIKAGPGAAPSARSSRPQMFDSEGARNIVIGPTISLPDMFARFNI